MVAGIGGGNRVNPRGGARVSSRDDLPPEGGYVGLVEKNLDIAVD